MAPWALSAARLSARRWCGSCLRRRKILVVLVVAGEMELLSPAVREVEAGLRVLDVQGVGAQCTLITMARCCGGGGLIQH